MMETPAVRAKLDTDNFGFETGHQTGDLVESLWTFDCELYGLPSETLTQYNVYCDEVAS